MRCLRLGKYAGPFDRILVQLHRLAELFLAGSSVPLLVQQPELVGAVSRQVKDSGEGKNGNTKQKANGP